MLKGQKQGLVSTSPQVVKHLNNQQGVMIRPEPKQSDLPVLFLFYHSNLATICFKFITEWLFIHLELMLWIVRKTIS